SPETRACASRRTGPNGRPPHPPREPACRGREAHQGSGRAALSPDTVITLRPLSLPRPISSQRLEREAFADRAEDVAFDDTGGRYGLGDRLADMGEPHRTAGQEHRVDVVGGQSRLRETDLDAGGDALGQLPGMAD